MNRILTFVMSTTILLTVTPLWSADKEKDEDRLAKSGTVLKEILDIPDDGPKDLLGKAGCVVDFPSVVKAAFIVGRSYGRGAMTCRTRKDFESCGGGPTTRALQGRRCG